MKSSELFSRVGRKDSSEEPPSSLILLFASGNQGKLENLLELEGYTVVVPSTADQAVAICLHNRVVAAIIDETSLQEDDDWSLAQSLKMVSANTPVVMMVDGVTDDQTRVPERVDFVVSANDPGRILSRLKLYLRDTERKQAG